MADSVLSHPTNETQRQLQSEDGMGTVTLNCRSIYIFPSKYIIVALASSAPLHFATTMTVTDD